MMFISLTYAKEYIRNTSFEDEGHTSAEAKHWGVWGVGLARVAEWHPIFDGDFMMGYKHWELPTGSTGSSGIFQDLQNVKIGQVYTFSVNVYADSPEWGSLAEKIELCLEGTVNGEQVIFASEEFSINELAANGSWKRLSVQAMASTELMRVLVIFYPYPNANKGGAVKIDGIDVTRESFPSKIK